MVAERLGYSPDTALSLGRAACGASARTKTRRLGIMDEAQKAAERNAAAAGLKPKSRRSRLLGHDISVLATADGTLRAEDGGKPALAKSVQFYIAEAFDDQSVGPGRNGTLGCVAPIRGTEPRPVVAVCAVPAEREVDPGNWTAS